MVATFGEVALAGYGIGSRIEFLLIPLVFGIGAAMTSLVGLSVGAGNYDRAEHIGCIGAFFAAGLTGFVGWVLALFPDVWIYTFTNDPETFDAARSYIQIVGPFFAFQGLGLSLYFASQGSQRHALAHYRDIRTLGYCGRGRLDARILVRLGFAWTVHRNRSGDGDFRNRHCCVFEAGTMAQMNMTGQSANVGSSARTVHDIIQKPCRSQPLFPFGLVLDLESRPLQPMAQPKTLLTQSMHVANNLHPKKGNMMSFMDVRATTFARASRDQVGDAQTNPETIQAVHLAVKQIAVPLNGGHEIQIPANGAIVMRPSIHLRKTVLWKKTKLLKP